MDVNHHQKLWDASQTEGEHIKALIEGSGMNQRDAAASIGRDQAMISVWVNDKIRARPEDLDLLVEACKEIAPDFVTSDKEEYFKRIPIQRRINAANAAWNSAEHTGQRVKAVRLALGFSEKQAAEVLSISATSYNARERQNPALFEKEKKETLVSLAKEQLPEWMTENKITYLRESQQADAKKLGVEDPEVLWKKAKTPPEYLYALRLKSGLSQKELAGKVGVTQVTILNWEKGIHSPETEQVESLIGVVEEACPEWFTHQRKAAYRRSFRHEEQKELSSRQKEAETMWQKAIDSRERVRAIRHATGLTQEEFAEKATMNFTAFRHREAEGFDIQFSLDDLQKIASAAQNMIPEWMTNDKTSLLISHEKAKVTERATAEANHLFPEAQTPGAFLRALRVATGLSMTEACKRIEVNRSHFNNMENDNDSAPVTAAAFKAIIPLVIDENPGWLTSEKIERIDQSLRQKERGKLQKFKQELFTLSDIQTIVETGISLLIEQWDSYGVTYSDKDLAYDLNSFGRRVNGQWDEVRGNDVSSQLNDLRESPVILFTVFDKLCGEKLSNSFKDRWKEVRERISYSDLGEALETRRSTQQPDTNLMVAHESEREVVSHDIGAPGKHNLSKLC